MDGTKAVSFIIAFLLVQRWRADILLLVYILGITQKMQFPVEEE